MPTIRRRSASPESIPDDCVSKLEIHTRVCRGDKESVISHFRTGHHHRGVTPSRPDGPAVRGDRKVGRCGPFLVSQLAAKCVVVCGCRVCVFVFSLGSVVLPHVSPVRTGMPCPQISCGWNDRRARARAAEATKQCHFLLGSLQENDRSCRHYVCCQYI
jgi:hypothetical protein